MLLSFSLILGGTARATAEGCDGSWWAATPHAVRVAHLNSAESDGAEEDSAAPTTSSARWFASPFARAPAATAKKMLYGGVLDTLRAMPLDATSVLAAADVAFPVIAASGCLDDAGRDVETRLVSARAANLAGTRDDASQAKAQMSAGRSTFCSRVSFGLVTYLVMEERRASDGATCSHSIAVRYGRDRVHRLIQHTWRASELAAAAAAADGGAVTTILSYNLWNSNPPKWIFHGHGRTRDEWYNKRIDHFAALILASGADVVGLQEVRWDTQATDSSPFQLDHIARRLGKGWQYVWIAAMSYWDDTRFPGVEDEGMAVFSRYPITALDHIVLSRNHTDGDDGHQRAVLHATVELPPRARARADTEHEAAAVTKKRTLHVFASHFSLSVRARNEAVVAVERFVTSNSSLEADEHSVGAVFLGDLNAEPQEEAMMFLRGAKEINGCVRRSAILLWLIYSFVCSSFDRVRRARSPSLRVAFSCGAVRQAHRPHCPPPPPASTHASSPRSPPRLRAPSFQLHLAPPRRVAAAQAGANAALERHGGDR